MKKLPINFTCTSISPLKYTFWFYILLFTFLFNEIHSQSFGNLPMGGAGFVSGIVYSKTEPNLKYARTDVGGAYRWDALKSRWIALNDWVSSAETGYLGVESLALDPNDPDKLYMSVGISYFNNGKSAILRSSDRGNTFEITDVTSKFKIHGNGMGRNTGEKLVVDPNLGSVLYCGSRTNGLFKSLDFGASWNRLSSLDVTTTSSENGISFVVLDPASAAKGTASQTIIVGISRVDNNLYRSDDGGATFFPVPDAPTTFMPGRSALASDGNLYITYTNTVGPWGPATGQIWKYNLSSGNWTNITPATYNLSFGGISVDPNNPERIVASTISVYRSQGNNQWGDLIFISTNGGTSWINKISSGYKLDPNGIEWAKNGVAIHWAGCIEFDPFNTKRVSVISGNGIFTTDNIDSTTNLWRFDVKGLEETVPMDMVSIPGGPVISVVGDYDGCRYTNRSEYGKQHSPAIGTTVGIAYAAMNPKVVVRAGSKLYFSSDTAKTWKPGTINGSQGYVSLSADGSVLMHSPENASSTFRSTDMGNSWTQVSGLNSNGARTVADPVNSSVFYAYNGSKMLVSLNSGASFAASGSPGGGGSKHIRTVAGFEGHVWVALYSGGLTRSIDYGAKFVKLTGVSSCSAVGFGKAAPGANYPTIFIWGIVKGVEGLFCSTNEGVNWIRINDDAHEWGGPGNGQFVFGDMNELGLAYMSTAGRGIVYAKADYLLSSSSLIIPVDNTSQIMTFVLNGETVSWTWKSSDTLVAEVDAKGMVSALSPGTAVITATSNNGTSLNTTVTVAVPVTGLSLSPEIDTIAIGAEVQFSASVIPADATNTAVSWSTVNPLVATVSSSGLVKGIKTGSTIITAMIGSSLKASITLIVGIPLTGISINPETDTIYILEKALLTALLIPSNSTDQTLKWITDKPTVANVDAAGMVTGISKGLAIISVVSSDGVIKESCNITVADSPVSYEFNSIQSADISVFPNPLYNKQLSIDLGGFGGKTSISFIDINGRTLLKHSVISKQRFFLDVDLTPGLYLVQFVNERSSIIKMLMVE